MLSAREEINVWMPLAAKLFGTVTGLLLEHHDATKDMPPPGINLETAYDDC